MQMWIPRKKCTGCGACSNICSKAAITMKEDDCGFRYPVIDENKCINCGLCKKTCPILEKFDIKCTKKPNIYAAYSKDDGTRFTSTSGGMFAEISKIIIKNNGVVIGAKYNNENMVEHAIARKEDELEALKQSKYLQSDTKNIYKETQKILNTGKLAAFCGAPCQIGGLYQYLQKDYDNLLTIEFICRGINSPKAYKYWLKEISETNGNKRIIKVWFKYKQNGWKKSPRCTRIDFEDGTYKLYAGDENLFMSGYLTQNLYIRPSCGSCHFKGLSRQADITLADFWNINKEFDDDKGTSLVLINSVKGEKWFSDILSNIHLYKKDFQDLMTANGKILLGSVKINKNSERFLKGLNQYSFSSQLQKYGKEPFYIKGFNGIKKIARRYIRKK